MESKVFKSLAAALTLVALVTGCSNKNNSNGKTTGRTQGGTAMGNPSPIVNSTTYSQTDPRGMYWQMVNVQNVQSVMDLIGPNPPFQVNFPASGCTTQAGQPCAVLFNVSVNPYNQQYQPLQLSLNGNQNSGNGMSNYTVNMNTNNGFAPGVVTIAIYDALTGPSNSAIAVAADLTSAQLAYNSQGSGMANAQFNDINVGGSGPNSGGTIQGRQFQGNLTFGSGENLGTFTTDICAIFQCQN